MFCRNYLNRKGSVTISVMLILLAICILNLVLVDYSRSLIYKKDLRQRLALCVSSVMSYYDYALASEYDLYGYCITGNYDANNLADRYFKGCDFKDKDSINLLAYDCIEISAELESGLDKHDILQKQVIDVMKYKSSANLLSYVSELFGIADSADKSKDIYALSGKIAQMIDDTSEILVMLKSEVEGAFDGDRLCVNGIKYFKYDTLLDSVTGNNLNDVYFGTALIRDTLTEYREHNNKALYYCNCLSNYAEEIDMLIKEAQDKCSDSPEADQTFSPLIEKLKNNKASISNLGIRNAVSENVLLLSDMITEIQSIIDNEGAISKVAKVMENIAEVNTDLTVNVVRAGSEENYQQFDNREEIQIQYNERKYETEEEENEEDNCFIEENIYITLPSVLAGENNPSIGDYLNNTIDLSGFDSIGMILDGDIFGGLKDAGSDLLTTALVDDYIINHMRDRLNGSKTRTLKSEIEYIIAGHKNDKDNNKEVRNKIFLLRFILNVIHVFRDNNKRALAEAIGNSIAASCSYGVGGAVYALIIIAGWSLAESFCDISTLLDGQSVPLIKDADDWKLSIKGLAGGLAPEDGEEEGAVDKLNDFEYEEYLRVLLMMTPVKTKLFRTADIIELNMSKITGRRYRLAGIYNTVVVTACVDTNLYAISFLGRDKKTFYKEVTVSGSYS